MDEHSDITDELRTRGLYDPEAPDAEVVLGTLRYALELGASLDELEAADNVVQLVARLLLRPGRERLTLTETATRAGLATVDAAAMWRACGFPDPGEAPIFTERDVEAFTTFAAAVELFGEEFTLSFGRVMGSAMARVADAAVSTFAVNVGAQSKHGTMDPSDPDQLARANQTAVGMLPMVVSVMDVLLRHHMEARSRDDIPMAVDFQGVDVVERGIGFCDLVGYTAFAGDLEHHDLGAVLSTFEAEVADRITAAGGQVVKLIGDEVMFVAPDADSLCAAGRAITEGLPEGLPPVRCGLASGPMILHEADYHGTVVNLAARLVKLAAPGQVLVAEALREAATDDFAFSDAGTHTLKGFDEPQHLFVLDR